MRIGNERQISLPYSKSWKKKCHEYLSLKNICFVTGYLNLILNTMQSLAVIVYAVLYATSSNFQMLTEHVPPTRSGKHRTGDCSCKYDINDLRICTCDESEEFRLQQIEETKFMRQAGFIIFFILVTHVATWVLNVFCLVGLHKNHPGPIKAYAYIASIRLNVALVVFTYLYFFTSEKSDIIACYALDIGLSILFIILYCIYANRLELERRKRLQQ